jgi:hypothetical protein
MVLQSKVNGITEKRSWRHRVTVMVSQSDAYGVPE